MLLNPDNDSFLFFQGNFRGTMIDTLYAVTCPGSLFFFFWCLSWCHLSIDLLLYVDVERSELSLVNFFPGM